MASVDRAGVASVDRAGGSSFGRPPPITAAAMFSILGKLVGVSDRATKKEVFRDLVLLAAVVVASAGLGFAVALLS